MTWEDGVCHRVGLFSTEGEARKACQAEVSDRLTLEANGGTASYPASGSDAPEPAGNAHKTFDVVRLSIILFLLRADALGLGWYQSCCF